jgi:glycosyltransferase involved in cell wall biosynthesis
VSERGGDVTGGRLLVGIPAYNEAPTIAAVVRDVRHAMPEADLLVVNDGSRDATADILRDLGVPVATHLCNLGYGRAIQTSIKYALANDYDILVTLDADGQHRPADIRRVVDDLRRNGWDALIGSRYAEMGSYAYAPPGRRLGMRLFSILTRVVSGRRIYDTTSGLKILRRSVFAPLVEWHFVDFHAEAIVYLSRLGFRVGEHPISAAERTHGRSMYSPISYLVYPLMTFTMVVLAVVQAGIARRTRP